MDWKSVAYILYGILLTHKNNKTLAFDTKWSDMEDLLLSEVSQAMKERHCMYPVNIYRLSALYGRERNIGGHKSSVST